VWCSIWVTFPRADQRSVWDGPYSAACLVIMGDWPFEKVQETHPACGAGASLIQFPAQREPFLVTEAISSAHFSAQPETFFVYGSYHYIQQKLLTSSRKGDWCSPQIVLKLSWKVDECKPLVRGAARVDHGRAVQVDPIKPALKAPGTKHLKLKCDILLSTSAFKINSRRYTMVACNVRRTHNAIARLRADLESTDRVLAAAGWDIVPGNK